MGLPVVRMSDTTFGMYDCKKKGKKEAAIGIVMTPGNALTVGNGLVIGAAGLCIAMQPACIKVPINMSIVGSVVSIAENKGMVRLNDPVMGIGIPGYTGTGMYTSGSPDIMVG